MMLQFTLIDFVFCLLYFVQYLKVDILIPLMIFFKYSLNLQYFGFILTDN